MNISLGLIEANQQKNNLDEEIKKLLEKLKKEEKSNTNSLNNKVSTIDNHKLLSELLSDKLNANEIKRLKEFTPKTLLLLDIVDKNIEKRLMRGTSEASLNINNGITLIQDVNQENILIDENLLDLKVPNYSNYTFGESLKPMLNNRYDNFIDAILTDDSQGLQDDSINYAYGSMQRRKRRAYLMDDTNGLRLGPIRFAGETVALEKDKALLKENSMGVFTDSGILKEEDNNWDADQPTDSAVHYRLKEIEKEKEAAKKEKEKQEQEKLKNENSTTIADPNDPNNPYNGDSNAHLSELAQKMLSNHLAEVENEEESEKERKKREAELKRLWVQAIIAKIKENPLAFENYGCGTIPITLPNTNNLTGNINVFKAE